MLLFCLIKVLKGPESHYVFDSAESTKNGAVEDVPLQTCSTSHAEDDFAKFVSYFDVDTETLSSAQRLELQQVLYKNRNVFVTDENPSLGFTTVVGTYYSFKPQCCVETPSTLSFTP